MLNIWRVVGIVLILFVGCSPSDENVSNLSPEEAAKKTLYDQGIHFSSRTFFQTVAKGDIETLDLFFEAGIDPNVRGEWNSSALMYGAGMMDAKVASYLLRRGVDVNAVSDHGSTALLGAAENNYAGAVEVFAEAGADLEAMDQDGKTALMLAARRGFPDVVALLLKAGADTGAIDEQGKSVLDLAKEAEAAGLAGGAKTVRLIEARQSEIE